MQTPAAPLLLVLSRLLVLLALFAGGRAPTQTLSLSFLGHRMTRATLRANDHLWIRRIRPQHPVQPHQQLPCYRYFGYAVVLFVDQPLIEPAQLWFVAGRSMPASPRGNRM